MTSAVSAAPRPLRPLNLRALVAILVAVGLVAVGWWSIPALSPQPFVAPPALSQSRLIELKANRVFTTRIVGLDVRASTAGSEVRLVGGYMDPQQIVLFLRIDPPARLLPADVVLRDQFGRSFFLTGAVADLATGENLLYFSAPGFPLLHTGARLTLEASQLERMGPQRLSASVSLTAVLLANDPAVGAFVQDMAINYVILGLAAAAYLALIAAGLRVWRRPASERRAYLLGVSSALLFLVLALPTYVAVGALVRHDPIGPGGLERQPDPYLTAAEVIAFYGIQAVGVVIGTLRAKHVAGQLMPLRAPRLGLAAGGVVVAFLVIVQPLAEIANACYIGWGFLLRMSC